MRRGCLQHWCEAQRGSFQRPAAWRCASHHLAVGGGSVSLVVDFSMLSGENLNLSWREFFSAQLVSPNILLARDVRWLNGSRKLLSEGDG